MDCVVTVVAEPFGDLTCEVVGPSGTLLPLISTAVVRLTLDCWATSQPEHATLAIKQENTAKT